MTDFAQFDIDEEVDEFAMDDKAAAKAERMAEAAAIRAAFKAQSKQGVSTETHTAKEVAAHFLIWRKLKGAKALVPVAVPETPENLKKYASARSKALASQQKLLTQIALGTTKSHTVKLKQKAFDAFGSGVDVKSVASQLSITYANAHYYYRAFKKQLAA